MRTVIVTQLAMTLVHTLCLESRRSYTVGYIILEQWAHCCVVVESVLEGRKEGRKELTNGTFLPIHKGAGQRAMRRTRHVPTSCYCSLVGAEQTNSKQQNVEV